MAQYVHLFQWFALWIAAIWWSKHTLMDRGGGIFWRQVLSALVGVILWIPVAYLSTEVAAGNSGVVTLYGSDALGYVGVVMAIFMVLTLILSLIMWAEEEAEEAAEELKDRLPGPQP
jgi:low temperature requirement protein LtrA